MFRLSLPGALQQFTSGEELPASGPLAGKRARDGHPTAYACLGHQCSPPITDTNALLDLLRGQRAVARG
jgi:uncharacterized protein YyaL (SSP411 family)